MLNPNSQERELAYVVKIDTIEPIVGSDNCECAVVGGWRIMTRIGTFIAGDRAVYFEIDSKVDTSIPAFEFLEARHGKIKTQRYTFGGKGNFVSQGLLMSFEDLSLDKNLQEGTFLTKELNVTYADAFDNIRKAATVDKYKKMANKYSKLFSKKPIRWLMRRTWGKKILFIFFGKGANKKASTWPAWVHKTDEERAQNLPSLFPGDNTKWIATEKIDGTSTTFTMKRGRRKNEFYVCSRNVVFDKPDKTCFYPTNVYLEMAEKYRVETILKGFLIAHPKAEWVTLQGETYGEGIQKRDYGLKGHDFMGFNLITSNEGRWNSEKAAKYFKGIIPWVPIIATDYVLPETCDELLSIATGASKLDGGPREGLVFRSQDGARSFKAVSNEFLLKFH